MTHTRVGIALRSLGWLAALALLGVIIFGGFFQTTVVSGHSMDPTYHTGDLVISVKTNDYKVGDVVVYHPNSLECSNCNIVHRIVKGTPSTYWMTQGDNKITNPNVDQWQFHNNEVHGKVLIAIPSAGVMPLLTSKWLWVTFIALVGSFLAFLFFRDTLEENPAPSPIETSSEETPKNEEVHTV